jgi:hypothetical protein
MIRVKTTAGSRYRVLTITNCVIALVSRATRLVSTPAFLFRPKSGVRLIKKNLSPTNTQ